MSGPLIMVSQSHCGPCIFRILIILNYIYIAIIIYLLLIKCGDIESNPGPTNVNNLKLCHINARSLTANNRMDEIENFVTNENNFEIIAISESKLDHTVDNSRVDIANYNLFRKDRNRNGGGVCLYVNCN